MMAGRTPQGRYQLRRGIRLIEAPEGGVILQSNPLRAIKINRPAFEILKQCESGVQAYQMRTCGASSAAGALLDTFRQGGLLDWMPPPARSLPLVSIIIPVYNRPDELEACLASLQQLDYPPGRVEVIVVDDASWDHTAAMARRFDVRLIIQPHNMGQSAARNTGAAAARGEILAFLDSDCVAEPGWLSELVPYFQDSRVALVGGYVAACYDEKLMDRYEQVCSALNMGADPAMGSGSSSVFYVPTCNMLVRRDIYSQAGGLDESLHVGEDVDLCWRLMADHHHLLYVPRGRVLHKHRSNLLSGFARRFDYGTSEAVLYSRFPRITKQFPWQPAGLGIIVVLMTALATRSWIWLVLAAGMLALETGCKWIQLKYKMDIRLPRTAVLAAVVKGHFQLGYYLAFYLVRYHLLLLIGLSVTVPSLIGLWLAVITLPTLVVYLRKRPRMSFPVFAFFYLAEHAFYQSGAFWGCLKQKSFRLYGISFRPSGFLHRSKRPARGCGVSLKKAAREAVGG
jgi:mycofactocin glycosyltransferase